VRAERSRKSLIEVLSALLLNEVPDELSQLIAQIPANSAEHARLRRQRRSRTTFVRLRPRSSAAGTKKTSWAYR
jgi:hypothetical protein